MGQDGFSWFVGVVEDRDGSTPIRIVYEFVNTVIILKIKLKSLQRVYWDVNGNVDQRQHQV